jgi:endonuclease/exonuclease/phosphatase family metal-dependent hydrolase
MTPAGSGNTLTRPISERLGRVSNFLAWVALSPVVGVSVFRAVPREWPTPVVQLLAFTPWMVAPALLALVLGTLARRLQTVTVSVLLLGVQIFWLFPPDAENSPAAEVPGAELKAMNINAELGQADTEEIVRLVQDNHVGLLTVQEHTLELEDRLAAAGLDSLLPNRISHPREGAEGCAVFSVHPLQEVDLVPDAHFTMPLVRMKIRDGGREAMLDVVNVHTLAPLNGRVARWRADLAALSQLAAGNGQLLLIGDFNATYDHWEFRKLLDRGPGQTKLVDVGIAAGARLVPTLPMKGLHLPGITIDHIVTTPHVRSSGYSVRRVSGTDHAAVLATLHVPLLPSAVMTAIKGAP